MKVIRARILGYCMGVRRAVETAFRALDENAGTDKKVFTLGPLIHNPSVLGVLENRGMSVLDARDLSVVDKNSVVVVRAHGTTPAVMKDLEDRAQIVLDATCPRVHLSQKRAAEWAARGFTVIVAGDRNHGEVVSISAYADGKAIVIENTREALALEIPQKSVLIAQTTFSLDEFSAIAQILKEKNADIQVFNSICSATMERQNALRDLQGKADGILVIGGKNSANTRRLFETAASICKNAALIENQDEIPLGFFDLETVAITAGASTPDQVIDAVEQKLLS